MDFWRDEYFRRQIPIGLCPPAPVELYRQPTAPSPHPITLDYRTLGTPDEMVKMAERRLIIQNVIHNPTETIPRDIVIIFIASLVREIQYIMFLNYLRKECNLIQHDSSPDDIFNLLFYGQQKFSAFDRESLWRAISECIMEVRAAYKALKLYEFRSLLGLIESIEWNSEIEEDLKELENHCFSGLNFDDREEEIWQYKRSLYRSRTIGFKKTDIFAREPPQKREKLYRPIDPISNLVFDILEKDYVMNPDPVVELGKMKAADPDSYEDHFIYDYSRVEYLKRRSGIIRVDNLSLHATTSTILDLFSSCGHISHIELTSGDKSQTAFVTFMDSESIERALHIKDKISENQSIVITSISQYKVENVDKSDVDEVVDGDVSNIHKALLKYWCCTQYQDLEKYFNQLCLRKASNAESPSRFQEIFGEMGEENENLRLAARNAEILEFDLRQAVHVV